MLRALVATPARNVRLRPKNRQPGASLPGFHFGGRGMGRQMGLEPTTS